MYLLSNGIEKCKVKMCKTSFCTHVGCGRDPGKRISKKEKENDSSMGIDNQTPKNDADEYYDISFCCC